jgi:hypothetical protein
MALYVVRVPQARVLPLTSFRFHLAMDTLAVQLMVATAKLLSMPGALDTHGQARGILPFGLIKKGNKSEIIQY